MDVQPILEHLAAAAAGGIGSLTTALLSARKQFKEVKASGEEVTKDLAHLKQDAVSNSAIQEWKERITYDFKQKATAAIEEFKPDFLTRLDNLKRGFRLELDSQKEEVDRRFRDLDRPTRPDLTTLDELRRRLDGLENRIDKIRDDRNAYVKAETFSDYVEEQTRQWNEVNRRLGEIMGTLRTRSKTPFPQSR